MSGREQRRHERYEVGNELAADIHLRTAGDARHPIRAVRDISSSGVSLFLDTEIAPADKVAIEFDDAGVRMEVYGTVAWCSASESVPAVGEARGPFVAGIELMSPLLFSACMPRHYAESVITG